MDEDEEISAADFLEWAKKNPLDFYDLYYFYHMVDVVKDAEESDFFGTEGFNKRFA